MADEFDAVADATTAVIAHALLNSMAQAYEQKGDNARAAAALRRSLAQRPDQPDRAAELRKIESQQPKQQPRKR